MGAAGTISADDIYFVGSDGEILGDSGDDLLRGGEGDDGILGLSGDDTIYGGGGGDSIHGGEGVDHIYGNDGDDLLYVGAGDHAYGGSGFDQFTVLNDATGAVIEDFQSGTDIVNIQYYSAEGTLPTPDLTLRDTESGDTIVSLDGSDVLRIVGGGGSFSLADISLEDTIEEPSWWSRI